jgi:hypothetical protein
MMTHKRKFALASPVITLVLCHWSNANILNIEETGLLFIWDIFFFRSFKQKPTVDVIDILVHFVDSVRFQKHSNHCIRGKNRKRVYLLSSFSGVLVNAVCGYICDVVWQCLLDEQCSIINLIFGIEVLYHYFVLLMLF